MDVGRDENIAIFNDTIRLCETNARLKKSVANATAAQKLILEKEVFPAQNRDIYETPANVVVSKKRTFEAAKAYKGTKVAVHNFASASNPGGGVTKGSSAQEECLCRCSVLYLGLNSPTMMKEFYIQHRAAHDPLHNDDVIYTPGVTVFKTDTLTPELMHETEWYDVDVITCAAPNLRQDPSNSYNSGDGSKAAAITNDELQALHEKRLRRILEIAVSQGVETIILGAFGCGAFQNDPEVVAQANRNVIKDYLHAFKNIEYAVYCSPRDERNYRAFERTIMSVGE